MKFLKVKYIHKEGWKFILGLVLFLFILNYTLRVVFNFEGIFPNIILGFSIIIFGFTAWFFRNPSRDMITDDNLVISPADGKIVVVEEVDVEEYFSDRRLQVSIFMSPSNVHVNRNPVSGQVAYSKYHPGSYLVAWHPKSSSENERTTIVINNANANVMMRQIAGKLARRIVNYLEEGDKVEQGKDFGFIKFGSRVDLFLPVNSKINVQMGQKVKGGITVIAELPSDDAEIPAV